MSTISNAILNQLAADVDGFEGGDTTDLVKMHPQAIGDIVDRALTRAFNSVESIRCTRIEIQNVDSNGVTLRLDKDQSARCCHVGTITHVISLSWDELLDENVYTATLVQERWDAMQAADNAAKEQKYLREREAEQRRQYEQLKAKFGA